MSRELDRHRLTLPDVPLGDAAIRQLEIWLLDLLNVRLKATAGASGWRFNVQNLGENEPSGLGWGYVISNDSIDIGYGVLGLVFYDLSGQGVYLGSEDEVRGVSTSMVPGEWTAGVTDATDPDNIRGVYVALESTDGTAIIGIPEDGGAFVVRDNTNNVNTELIRKNVDDTTLHLPVGGNIIFDL